MIIEDLPNYVSGIYEIRNIITNKFYIGSTIDLEKRWAKHLYELRHNIHKNIKLQRSFIKYGESNFVYNPIYYCYNFSKFALLDIEQYYLDLYKPYYNLSENANGGCKSVNKFVVLTPNAEEIICDNLNEFCRRHNLSYGNLRKCAFGKIFQHKGYRCKFYGEKKYKFISKKTNIPRYTKEFIVRYPNGKEIIVRNLAEFARKNNLEITGLRHCVLGNNKTSQGLIVKLKV